MNEQLNNQRLTTLEAALYSAGRPVSVKNLKIVVRTKSDKVIHKLINSLAIRYEARKSALEVTILPENRVVMRLKQKYDIDVKKFTTKPLLTIGPLKTLSYIAYHQPVMQSQVVEDRGSHVYAHLKQMEEMGLIIRERLNPRGNVIETTAYFADYFGFGQDPEKSKIQLHQMFNEIKIHKMDNGEEENTPPKILEQAFTEGPLADSRDRLT